MEAFSITLLFTVSNLVSNSLAPPRIAITNEGGLTTELRLDHDAVVEPLRLEMMTRAKRQVLMVGGITLEIES